VEFCGPGADRRVDKGCVTCHDESTPDVGVEHFEPIRLPAQIADLPL
jgi:hypothetical protein